MRMKPPSRVIAFGALWSVSICFLDSWHSQRCHAATLLFTGMLAMVPTGLPSVRPKQGAAAKCVRCSNEVQQILRLTSLTGQGVLVTVGCLSCRGA